MSALYVSSYCAAGADAGASGAAEGAPSHTAAGGRCFTLSLIELAKKEAAPPLPASESSTRSRAASSAVGDSATFKVADAYLGAYYTTTATLKKIGTYNMVYVEDSQYVSASSIASISSDFDSKVYPNATKYFGAPPDVDANGKIVLFLLDIMDEHDYISYYSPSVVGYFNPIDQTTSANSNRMDMLYIDVDFLTTKEKCGSTLVHELQHLIHYKYDSNEDTYINEGLSEYASYVLGYKDQNGWDLWNHIQNFVATPDNSLTEWGDGLGDYGAAGLFMLYISEHYGGDSTIKKVVADTRDGSAGVSGALLSAGYPSSVTFKSVFEDWVVANRLGRSAPTINSGKYSYSGLDLSASAAASYRAYPVSSKKDTVQYWAAKYLVFSGGAGGKLSIVFDGADANSFSVSAIKAGAAPDVERMQLDASSKKGQITIGDFGKTYTGVVLCVSSNSNSGANPASFEYSAVYTESTESGVYFYDVNYSVYDPFYFSWSMGGPIKNTLKFYYDVDTSDSSSAVSVSLSTWKFDDGAMSFMGKKTDAYTIYGKSAENRSLSYTAFEDDYYMFNLSLYDGAGKIREYRSTPWLFLKVWQAGTSNEWFEDTYYDTFDSNGDNKSDTLMFGFMPKTASYVGKKVTIYASAVDVSGAQAAEIYRNYTINSASSSYFWINWSCRYSDFYDVLFWLKDETGSLEDFRHVQDVYLEAPHEALGKELNVTFDGSGDGLYDTFSFIYTADTTASSANVSVILDVYLGSAKAGRLYDNFTIRRGATEFRYMNWSAAANGTYSMYVQLADEWGSIEERRDFPIVPLSKFNRAPVITGIADFVNITIGAAYSCGVNATDADGDAAAFAIAPAPLGMAINAATGVINWTPAAEQIGWNNFTVYANDGTVVVGKNVSLRVRGENEAPESITLSRLNATEGEPFLAAVSAFDYEGNPITFRIASGPANMSINRTSGEINWTPKNADVGTAVLAVEASDGNHTSNATFTIIVANVNTPPRFVYVEPNATAVSIRADREKEFMASAEDEDAGDVVSYKWYLNGTLVSLSNVYTYAAGLYDPDSLSLVCEASDGTNASRREWQITVRKTNAPPQAFIDLVTPNPANLREELILIGHGIDSDGTIEGYAWSYEGGQFGSTGVCRISSLPAGNHTIRFAVEDNEGNCSEEALIYVNIGANASVGAGTGAQARGNFAGAFEGGALFAAWAMSLAGTIFLSKGKICRSKKK